VTTKCEKGRGANHDPSEVKRYQAPAGKTTIQRKRSLRPGGAVVKQSHAKT